MLSRFRSVVLIALLAGPAALAEPPRKYLQATSHYLHAETVDLSALPEPPRPGSLAFAVDLETILQLQAWRSPEQVAWAKQVDQLDAFDAGMAMGPWFTRAKLPVCGKLLDEALGDGESVNYVAKLKYKRLRPPFQDPRVQPSVPVFAPTTLPLPAGYFSYPSGHATSIYLLAEVLAELAPARREAVQTWAHRSAWSRMIAGVHFPSDDLGGQILAGIVMRTLQGNPAFQAALAQARAELASVAPA